MNTNSLTNLLPIPLFQSNTLFVRPKEPIHEERKIVAESNNAVSLKFFFIIIDFRLINTICMRQIVCSTYRRKFIIFSLKTKHFSLFFAKIAILLDRIICKKAKSASGKSDALFVKSYNRKDKTSNTPYYILENTIHYKRLDERVEFLYCRNLYTLCRRVRRHQCRTE